MSAWRILATVLIAVVVQACGPIYETSYQFSPPQTAQGRHCASQCQELQGYCRRDCRAEARDCKEDARRQARWDYERYVRQRRAEKKNVERSLDSFVSDYHCREDDCSETCEEDFRLCFSNCGGRVTAHTVCTFNCDEVETAPRGRTSRPGW